jgi:hypothetical protein
MKFIAMYLPGFHNCPFNEKWWGEGFTEWNNVKNAKPVFEKHLQPKIPLDGFYRLDTTETIREQAKLASLYGIYGFSIYHYWYEGRRPLSRPIDLILQNKDIDIKFCLCWANHSWTRSWKNRSGALDVLIEQTYEIDRNSKSIHEEYLCAAFKDDRYIERDGKPLFQIYAPENISNLEDFIYGLRIAAKNRLGREIHISAMLTAWQPSWEYLKLFDSATLFQPSLATFSPQNLFGAKSIALDKKGISATLRASPLWLKKILYKIQDILPASYIIYDYDKVWEDLIHQFSLCSSSSFLPINPMAFVSFDNTPRYGNRAKIYNGYSSEKFRQYLLKLSSLALEKALDSFVFINAWNEWGEGMYMEPDCDDKYSRLEAIKFVNEQINL